MPPDEVLKYKVELDTTSLETQLSAVRQRFDNAMSMNYGINPNNGFATAFKQTYTNSPYNQMFDNNESHKFDHLANGPYLDRLQKTSGAFLGDQAKQMKASVGDLWRATPYMQGGVSSVDFVYAANERLNRTLNTFSSNAIAHTKNVLSLGLGWGDKDLTKHDISETLHKEFMNIAIGKNSQRGFRTGVSYETANSYAADIAKGRGFNIFDTGYFANLWNPEKEMPTYNQLNERIGLIAGTGMLAGSSPSKAVDKIKEVLDSFGKIARTMQLETDKATAEFIGRMNSKGITNANAVLSITNAAERASQQTGLNRQVLVENAEQLLNRTQGMLYNPSTIIKMGLSSQFIAGANQAEDRYGSQLYNQAGGAAGIGQIISNANLNFNQSQFGTVMNLGRAMGYKGDNFFDAMNQASTAFSGGYGKYASNMFKMRQERSDRLGNYGTDLDQLSIAKTYLNTMGASLNEGTYTQYLIDTMHMSELDATVLAKSHFGLKSGIQEEQNSLVKQVAKKYAETKQYNWLQRGVNNLFDPKKSITDGFFKYFENPNEMDFVVAPHEILQAGIVNSNTKTSMLSIDDKGNVSTVVTDNKSRTDDEAYYKVGNLLSMNGQSSAVKKLMGHSRSNDGISTADITEVIQDLLKNGQFSRDTEFGKYMNYARSSGKSAKEVLGGLTQVSENFNPMFTSAAVDAQDLMEFRDAFKKLPDVLTELTRILGSDKFKLTK